jgi:hypothetical protein
MTPIKNRLIEVNDLNLWYYSTKDKTNKNILLLMGRPDEILENPAVANEYTYEEVFSDYVKKRASRIFSSNVDNVLIDVMI